MLSPILFNLYVKDFLNSFLNAGYELLKKIEHTMYTCYFLIFVYQSMKLSEDNKANCNEYICFLQIYKKRSSLKNTKTLNRIIPSMNISFDLEDNHY